MAVQPGLMWDLVGNPENRFSHNEAHIILVDFLNIINHFVCSDSAFHHTTYKNTFTYTYICKVHVVIKIAMNVLIYVMTNQLHVSMIHV